MNDRFNITEEEMEYKENNMNDSFNITEEELEILEEMCCNYTDEEMEEVNDGYDFD